MTDVKSATPTASPVKVGAVFAGANLNGAFVRDTRLINEIARRGIPTAKWWAMDLPPQLGVDGETLLFHAARFARVPQRFLGETLSQCLMERLGIVGSCVGNKISPKATDWGRSRMSRWALRKVAAEIVRGVDRDQRLMRRIATALDESGVTHVMPMISLLAPFLLAARQYCSREIRVVVTFQGYEVYTNAAREVGLLEPLLGRLKDAVLESDFPAITVSEPYAERIRGDIGLAAEQLVVIPPGVPAAQFLSDSQVEQILETEFGLSKPEVPIVSYFGRQDSEKGIDLLLYAAKLLETRGERFQLVIAGPNAFGSSYSVACRHIAEHLRLPVVWCSELTDESRRALMQASHCVVYPSIHCEPFGMVPVEAMSFGTPCVVADQGCVSELVRWGELQGGLTFRAWDSGNLANVLAKMLNDLDLHGRLVEDGPNIASKYSVNGMADQVLAHLGISLEAQQTDFMGRPHC